jgi:2'-5' RNA ligase
VIPSETARLFAALELPGAARSALASWGARVAGSEPGVRLVPIGSLHVTLVFLGSQPLEQVKELAGAVVSAARALAPLTVTRAAWLPSRRPGVLVADLAEEDGDGELTALQADLVAALAPWHEPEARGFRPHVTVARVRRGARIDPRQQVAEPPVLRFAPTALVLYRSRPGGAGAVYEAVASAPLG